MTDPYTVLGVPRGSSHQAVDEAYKRKARAYREAGRYDKLAELDEAYDEIIMQSSGSYTFVGNDFSDIEAKINAGRLEDAQTLLDGIPLASRNAQWYYLRGVVYERKGWLDEAANHFRSAYNMDPGSDVYRQACERADRARSGGYRTSRQKHSSGRECSACDMCTGLLCADCCCECMGGDFIRCC